MKILWVLLFLSCSGRGNSQTVTQCPSNWLHSQTDQKCYKLVVTPELNYEAATTYCAMEYGASLVSINSLQEFSQISTWLMQQYGFGYIWLTSGETSSPGIVFDLKFKGDNSQLDYQALQQMLATNFNRKGSIAILRHNGIEYKLDLATVTTRYSFICEIDQAMSYTIMHKRDFLFGTNFTLIQDAPKGPEFLETSSDVTILARATSAYMECRAVGNPSPTYKWFKLNGASWEEVTHSTKSSYTLTNGRLTIEGPTDEGVSPDSGRYRCSAMNTFGTIISPPVQVSFGSIGEFANVQKAGVFANAYEGANIECPPISYKPAVVYNWQRELINDGKGKDFIFTETTPFAFISTNGRLYFSEVTRQEAGNYYCMAVLSGISKGVSGSSQTPSKTSLAVPLIVTEKSARNDFGPIIHQDFINTYPKPVLRGVQATLECFAYGTSRDYFNNWEYKWTREGGDLPANHILRDFNRVLIIPNIQREDEGTYTCTVKRGVSYDSKSITLTLEGKPYFLHPLISQHVDEGSQVIWRCYAGGVPAPQYTWYKNGESITTLTNGVSINKNVMIINNAQARLHDGMYQCGATNQHGTTMSDGQLRVLSFTPRFASRIVQSKDAALNGNVTLECNPQGAPTPEITWFKVNSFGSSTSQITSGGNFRILPNGDLFITGITQSNEGYYNCTATNKLGQASSTKRLTVKSATTISTFMKKEDTAFLNDTVFLPCSASYDNTLDLIYYWNFNGHPLDLENNAHYRKGLQQYTNGLFISNVQFYHEGEYECIAKTPINMAFNKGILKVNGPPGEVVGVKVDDSTVRATSLELFWWQGKTNGNPITYYIIQAESAYDLGVWQNVLTGLPDRDVIAPGGNDMRKVQVTNLDPFNSYRFRIQAANSYGLGPFSQYELTSFSTTLTAAPSSPPLKVYGGDGSVGDLVIRWEVLPRRYRGAPEGGYRVYWRSYNPNVPQQPQWILMEVKNWDSNKFVKQVGEDNYYLPYEVKIGSFNSLGYSRNSSSVIIYSAEGMPTQAPSKVFGQAYNSTAMDIYWQKIPNNRTAMKGKVLGYQVNYWPLIHTPPPRKLFNRFLGDVNVGRIIGLEMGAYYVFDVQMYNSAGLGPVSESYQQETMNPAPGTYPTEINVYSNDATSVEVTWRGIITATAEYTLNSYTIFVWLANEDARTSRTILVDKLPTHAIIDKLEKDNVYALRIAGSSPGGIGKKSQTIYFTLGGRAYFDPTLTDVLAAASSINPSIIAIFLLSLILTFRNLLSFP